jgi:hypothetical protein
MQLIRLFDIYQYGSALYSVPINEKNISIYFVGNFDIHSEEEEIRLDIYLLLARPEKGKNVRYINEWRSTKILQPLN